MTHETFGDLLILILLGTAVFGIFGHGSYKTYHYAKQTGRYAEHDFFFVFFILLATLYAILVGLFIYGIFSS